MAMERGLPWLEVPGYIGAQTIGAFSGVAAAHIMFDLPVFSFSAHAWAGGAQIFSEFIATFGLLSVICGCSHLRPDSVAVAVAAYITGAYWFTSSTSFANPVVTLARSMTNTFSGIRLADVPGFIVAQLSGALVATVFWSWLLGRRLSHGQ
jgi:glycerol uptake facilitator-like aquaporin